MSEISENENLSDEDDDQPKSKHSHTRSGKKIINQMSTKLPFSAGGPPPVAEAAPPREDSRVRQGLVPSVNNKTKQLSKEQETLYTQIL